MAKPELGTKRQCPKCGTRFYDLGKSDPITCINCGQNFVPETILKPRRPVAEPVEVKAKVVKKPEPVSDDDDDLEDSDDSDMDQILEIEDEEDDIDVEVEVDVENDSDDDK
ncbi:TIGR02300 family protein [Emcibacter sp. SYSU 3D8]|uniref:TIGR02300 family protein n=1 Tax=Emcibacter sp. SYSU 3D8 TaxID=3133969 RepID=UPI0031FF2901